MGYYTARIGKYGIAIHDSSLYLKQQTSSKKTFFSKKKVDIQFYPDANKTTEIFIEFKTDLGKILPIIKKGNIYLIDYSNLQTRIKEFLFKEIQRRELEIEITPYVSAYPTDTGKDHWATFYLISELFVEPIRLSSDKPEPIKIINLKQIEWLKKNCLNYTK